MVAGVNEQEAEVYRARLNFHCCHIYWFHSLGILGFEIHTKRDHQEDPGVGLVSDVARRHCVVRATEMPPMW
jgi:hypothetical protein